MTNRLTTRYSNPLQQGAFYFFASVEGGLLEEELLFSTNCLLLSEERAKLQKQICRTSQPMMVITMVTSVVRFRAVDIENAV